ncbi:MAG TPA: 2,3-bisphosphoglycerate-dependent phosphoglycerate mutase [Thermohalobaculum sp.]|nr:2,3-bisphosphoglycerate-dependent phosphoglycerate mutase [Thermohalobaculum sp.]
MPKLVLIRHGATVAGEENRFAGWDDTPLSAAGRADAERAARTLGSLGIAFDLCLTSRLIRARQSLAPIAAALGLAESVIVHDWRMNERHYGALQGENRTAMIHRYGNANVVAWRRSYDARPPLLETDDPRYLEQRERFADVPPSRQPRGESLRDAVERVSPAWSELLAPALTAGKCVLVVAHTSSIRALARILEGLDDDSSAAFRIATAIPRCYELDDALRVVRRTDLTSGTRSRLRYWANRVKPRALGGI